MARAMRVRFPSMPLLPVLLAAVACCIWRVCFTEAPAAPVMGLSQWKGIVERSSVGGDGQHVVMRVMRAGRALLFIPSCREVLEPGTVIAFTAVMEPPVKRHPLADDVPHRLAAEGITMRALVPLEHISILGHSGHWRYRLHRFRDYLVGETGRSGLDGPTAQFVAATVLGDSSALTYERRMAFGTAGLAHLLALSGMHVALIAGIIAVLLSPLRLLGARRLQIAAAALLLWGYAAVTGFSPSVCRAVVMATALAMALIAGRHFSTANALALAAIILLVHDPYNILRPGFVMSFAAVGGILLFAHRLDPLHGRASYLKLLSGAVACTLAATLTTGILGAYYFHQFPVWFLPANIPALLIMPATVTCGMATVALHMCGITAYLLARLTDALYMLLEGWVRFVAALPFATLRHLTVEPAQLAVNFAALCAVAWAVYRLKGRRRVAVAGGAVVAAALGVACLGTSGGSSADEVLIVPGGYRHVSLLVMHGHRSMLVTTAGDAHAADIAAAAERHFSDLLLRHRCGHVEVARGNVDFGPVRVRGHRWHVCGRHLLVATRDSMIAGEKPDILVLGPGITRKSLAAARALGADSVAAAHTLAPKLRDYMLGQLAQKPLSEGGSP